MKKRVDYSLTETLIERMQKAKAKTGVPMSEICRRALNEYLKKLGF